MPMVPSGARQSANPVFGRRGRGKAFGPFRPRSGAGDRGSRASPFGAARGMNLRRDGMAGCPQASTRRPGRSLMSEPSGRIDRGLKDGAGRVARKRSVRMASEERAWLFGPEPIRDRRRCRRAAGPRVERQEPSGARRCRPRLRPALLRGEGRYCGCWMPGPGLPRRSTGKGPAAFSCRSPCRLRRRQSTPRFAGRGARSP